MTINCFEDTFVVEALESGWGRSIVRISVSNARV